MFIATSAHAKISLRLGAKPGTGTIGEQAKAIALLRSFGVKKGSPGHKHLAPSALTRAKRQTGVLLSSQGLKCAATLVMSRKSRNNMVGRMLTLFSPK
jgi:hypothetical protein